ncbi:MAG: tetratricopeptide repeat protein [Aliidiomarina sp.]|uniref:tetratricopeptide repeat protein n=1 Tax=Aliidiomarina sp. TaxID=1872439 RepID=UPI0025B8E193|nr:tetratricopeptide repeat protein [Aliidiomarina sp.]MCH8501340.1 tetratricopeptide repeat protein [Aliidiomarina sp.]
MNTSINTLTHRGLSSAFRYLLFLLLLCSVSFSVSANNDTDPIRLQYNQFDQFIQQQQGQQALQVAQQMMQSAPSHPLTGVVQARINLLRNNLAEAQLILNQILNAYPHQPRPCSWPS